MVILSFGLGLALFGLAYAYRGWRNAHERGHIRALHLVSGREPFLLVEEAISDLGSNAPVDSVVHLARLETRDGRVSARVSVDARTSFVGATAGGLWFEERGGLGIYRRDVLTLDVSQPATAWRARHPGLAEPLQVEGSLDAAHGIPIRFKDGSVQWLDPATLDVTPARDASILAGWKDRPSVRLARVAGGTVSVANLGAAEGQAQFVVAGRDARAIQCPREARSHVTFFDPAFLALADDHVPAAFDGREFLLVHRASMAPDAALQLSRTDCSGTTRWTRPLRGREIAGALSDGNDAFVVTHGSEGIDRLVAVAVDTGTVRWEYPR